MTRRWPRLVWFKSGGAAEWLFEPKDVADLAGLPASTLDPAVPVMALGLGSNLIVRDGGVPGVVVRLGKAFAKVDAVDGSTLDCGGGASGILVSSTARDDGIAGLEFLRSIPGTVGGFVRMNGGAYGGEVKDILVDCDVVLRNGELVTLPVDDLHYSYRHSRIARWRDCRRCALSRDSRASPKPSRPKWTASLPAARPRSRCVRKTGGSTFKNPDGQKAWQLVDEAGCRGLQIGGAQVSRKAHQLPDQHRRCHQRRYRSAG